MSMAILWAHADITLVRLQLALVIQPSVWLTYALLNEKRGWKWMTNQTSGPIMIQKVTVTLDLPRSWKIQPMRTAISCHAAKRGPTPLVASSLDTSRDVQVVAQNKLSDRSV